MMGLAIRSALLCGLPDLTYKRGGRKIFFAGETFRIDYDVGGTDPSLTLSPALSRPALALREKEGVGNRAGAREREMEREKERRNQIYS